MLNKKGAMMTKEVMEVVLGGAVVLVLLFLLYNLIAPNFDKGDETMDAYLNSLKDQIAVADDEGVGSFSIWQPVDDDEKKEFYLVYFGNHSSFGVSPRKFYSLGNNLNTICVCSWTKDESSCGACENLEFPVLFGDVEDYESWAVGLGDKLKITRKEDYYEFVRSE